MKLVMMISSEADDNLSQFSIEGNDKPVASHEKIIE